MAERARGVAAADVLDEVRRRAAEGDGRTGAEAIVAVVREHGAVLGREDLASLVRTVRAEVEGAGPLQPLLELPGVTDVLVNGPDAVWVDRGRGLERADVDLGDAAAVRALAVRLAAAGGQRLDDAAPVADARLPDGTRLHAVLPPVSPGGALLSLRVLRRTAFPLADLVADGTVATAVEPVLRALVARRANVLVSGATGTGKTTLLASLLSLVPHDERVVVIEEVGELAPDHPHVVRLTARRANVEGAGEVDLVALVRHALRMRPDRIVLGEARGAELREVLTALNTGHEGGWATLHANAAREVPARLEALGALAGMAPEAVAAQALGAVHAVVHLRRDDGRRRVAELGVVERAHDQRHPGTVGGVGLRVVPALLVSADGGVTTGPGWALLEERCGLRGWAG
ncbi:TadA family conjugal transfer-associated ATPase [Actinotalea ferrariae]|uniref:TadA family conjugal transfer-associated ATPase n=1 Tax=Actinotalea ferrariae TaxID=1386098 RepID=UPI001C8C319E|nr:TadA family conjugal transfer-associated ATPase [Actinotalea ferrariae]MBX9246613.1 TadA family conjugal transfer-associated ATPase [Actinotalea ferrariae]